MYVCICMCLCMCVCMYVCMYVCMCVYVYMFFLVFIDIMFHYKVILHVLSFLILNHIIAIKIVI